MKRIISVVGSILSATLVCALLSSCNQIDVIDASSNPKYLPLVGKKFRLKKEVWAIGFCLHYPKHEVADEILLLTGNRFANREVVSNSKLGKGTVIQIIGVEDTTSPMAKTLSLIFRAKYAHYMIKVIGSTPTQLPAGVPIKIRQTGNSDNRTYGLDGNAFEVLP